MGLESACTNFWLYTTTVIARVAAFTASYLFDAWWILIHPTDPQKVAIRAHDGSFLGVCHRATYVSKRSAMFTVSTLMQLLHS